MENVAHGAIINDHDFAQVWLHLCQVLDVCTVSKRAVLSIVPSCEVLALHFEPVNDRVGVFLYRGSEDYEVVPFTNLMAESAQSGSVEARSDKPFSKTHRNTAACAHNTR